MLTRCVNRRKRTSILEGCRGKNINTTQNVDKRLSPTAKVVPALSTSPYLSDTIHATTAKRFREFVGSAAFIEATVSDEVIGVLGFLSYDLVRTLCDGAMTSKRATELSIAKKAIQSRSEGRKKEATAAESEGVDDGKRPREEEDVAMEESEGTAGESKEKSTSTSTKPPKKLKKALSSTSIARVVSPATPRHQLVEPTSLFSLPPVNSPSDANSPHLVAPGSSLASDSITTKGKGMSLEELVHGISVNSDSARVSIRSGMKNWRSGARRPRV